MRASTWPSAEVINQRRHRRRRTSLREAGRCVWAMILNEGSKAGKTPDRSHQGWAVGLIMP